MAGFIEFSPNFVPESSEYMLFEFPTELRNQLKRDGSVQIQEHKNESYILGDDKLYQLQKFQISNLQLVSERAKESTQECERIKVRSFQQAFYIPTLVRPFSRDILIHLKYHYTPDEGNLEKEELSVDHIKSKFVTNDQMLSRILKSIGAEVHAGFIINLTPETQMKLSNQVFEKLVEKKLLENAESTFTIDQLGFDLNNEDQLRLVSAIKKTFDQVPETDQFRVSLKGVASLVIENLKKDVREYYLEDLVDLIREGFTIILPKAIQNSFGELNIRLAIENSIRKNFLVSDNIEFNAPAHTYVPKNASAVMTELELLSESPLEKYVDVY